MQVRNQFDVHAVCLAARGRRGISQKHARQWTNESDLAVPPFLIIACLMNAVLLVGCMLLWMRRAMDGMTKCSVFVALERFAPRSPPPPTIIRHSFRSIRSKDTFLSKCEIVRCVTGRFFPSLVAGLFSIVTSIHSLSPTRSVNRSSIPKAHMSRTSGLPGFLRRNLRRNADYEEDDEPEKSESAAAISADGVDVAVVEVKENNLAQKSVQLESSASVQTNLDRDYAGADTIIESIHELSRRIASVDPSSSELPSSHSDSWQEVSPPVSSNDTLSTSSIQKKTYRDIQFDKVLAADVINMVELRKLAWNGIPHAHRAQVWKLLLGYVPTNAARRAHTVARKRAEYRDAVAQHYDLNDDVRTLSEQETLRQVLVDVPRTQPDIPLFRNDRIKRALSRLLYVWAMRHPASSYVQGINDLATPLLAVFLADYYFGNEDNSKASSANSNNNIGNSSNDPSVTVLEGHIMNHCPDERLQEVEADVYWCLTNLLAGIQDHYTADQPGVQRMVARLEELVYRIDSDLTRHIRDDTGIQFLQFSFKWMNCLLLREFQLRCVFRLWDTYLSEKNGFEDFHVYVCAAFMCQFSSQLQGMTFDELFGFMQEIPTEKWTDTEIEVLLSQAFILSTLFKGSDAHLSNSNGI